MSGRASLQRILLGWCEGSESTAGWRLFLCSSWKVQLTRPCSRRTARRGQSRFSRRAREHSSSSSWSICATRLSRDVTACTSRIATRAASRRSQGRALARRDDELRHRSGPRGPWSGGGRVDAVPTGRRISRRARRCCDCDGDPRFTSAPRSCSGARELQTPRRRTTRASGHATVDAAPGPQIGTGAVRRVDRGLFSTRMVKRTSRPCAPPNVSDLLGVPRRVLRKGRTGCGMDHPAKPRRGRIADRRSPASPRPIWTERRACCRMGRRAARSCLAAEGRA